MTLSVWSKRRALARESLGRRRGMRRMTAALDAIWEQVYNGIYEMSTELSKMRRPAVSPNSQIDAVSSPYNQSLRCDKGRRPFHPMSPNRVSGDMGQALRKLVAKGKEPDFLGLWRQGIFTTGIQDQRGTGLVASLC